MEKTWNCLTTKTRSEPHDFRIWKHFYYLLRTKPKSINSFYRELESGWTTLDLKFLLRSSI